MEPLPVQIRPKLVHIPGLQMVQSDALSRRADHVPNKDTDNKDVMMLPDKLFVKFIDTDMHALFTEQIMKGDLVCDTITALKEKGAPPIKSLLEDCKVEDSLVFFRNRCYVPDNQELPRWLVEKYHNSLPSGHPGIIPS